MTHLRLPVLIRVLLATAPLCLALGCPPPTPTDAGPGDGDGDGDGDEDGGHEEQDLDQHGCDHMQYGPETPVTATATADGAPVIPTTHTRYDISLVHDDGADTHGGFVMLDVPMAGPVHLYFDGTVAVVVRNGGAVVTPTETGGLDLCADVATRIVVDLPMGHSSLELGPTDSMLVKMVARTQHDEEHHHEHDGGHHHEDDGGHHHHEDDGGHHHEDDGGHHHEEDGGHHHHEDGGHHEVDAGHGLAADYCECVFIRCHDAFHAKWGVDDGESIAACNAEAEALPSVGGDPESGNSIECRLHYCELPATDGGDAAVCEAALGNDDTCMELDGGS